MADVFGPNWLPASHLTGEIEQPTDAKSLMAPYTGDPQQMYQFLMDPKNQEQMSQFGVHFNPQTIHESPFFSQHFMQKHPQLGGRLSGAMASMAATPEAPMVSGAGSGIQRAMQGAMGGPQMLRQYQSNQLMGPMQQMGMQIPQMEFGRKQQLLGGMLGMMSSDEAATQAAQAEKARSDKENENIKTQQGIDRDRATTERINATRPTTPGMLYNPAQPQGQPTPSQTPSPQGMPFGGAPQMPGLNMSPGSPATQGGWGKDPAYWGEMDTLKRIGANRSQVPTFRDRKQLDEWNQNQINQFNRFYASYLGPMPPTYTGSKEQWAAEQEFGKQQLQQQIQQQQQMYQDEVNKLSQGGYRGAPSRWHPPMVAPGQNPQQPQASNQQAPSNEYEGLDQAYVDKLKELSPTY